MTTQAKKRGRKPTPPGEIKWDIKRRLEYIEFHVYWVGDLQRQNLMTPFKISTVQASKDIALYKQLAPDNLVYDPSGKKYSKSDIFKPQFISIEPHAYLSHLMALKAGYFSVETSLPMPEINTGIVPSMSRKIKHDVLRSIILTIHNKEDVEIQYQSMSSPKPVWRWITPHSFCFDGSRWHTRAFCHQSKTFKDFLLARILDIGDIKDGSAHQEDDGDWHKMIMVRIGPNPELSDGQKKIIEFDYDMQGGMKEIQIRKALLFYFYRNMRFDFDGRSKLPPHTQQLILLNKEDVEAHLPISDLPIKSLQNNCVNPIVK